MMNDMSKNKGVHCEVESCMYNTSLSLIHI